MARCRIFPQFFPTGCRRRCSRATIFRAAATPFASFTFLPRMCRWNLLNQFQSPAHRRLIFEEFFLYQLSLALRRKEAERHAGISFRVREPRVREALKRILPFKPTDAQKRVLAEIAADLEKPTSMHRLLQGDVGSGKTIVALEAATIAIENGYQVALMAPTEILAVQHFLSARRIFAASGYEVELLISGLKGQEKQEVIGAHAHGENAICGGDTRLARRTGRIRAPGTGDRR